MQCFWRQSRALCIRSGRLQAELPALQALGSYTASSACLHTSPSAAAGPEASSQRDWAEDLDFRGDIPLPAHLQEVAVQSQQSKPPLWLDEPRQSRRSAAPVHSHSNKVPRHSPQQGYQRNMFDYQRISNDVAAKRKTFLIRDVMDEMMLNGLVPDRVFLELSIMHCMRSSRIGDCFFYYNEMKRRGMQPSAKLQGLLISVLAREGHLQAAEEWYYKFRGETAADKFELQLAILNAYGEVGDVDKCHAVLTEMLTQNPNMPMLVTWGYNALLKAYRKVQDVDAVPDFPQRVLAAMHEGQKAQRRLDPEAESWSMPSYALFALQRQGFHKECVELFESLPPEHVTHPQSWAYNHIVMSYVKDGIGILRWPRKERDLKKRIKDAYLQEVSEGLTQAQQEASEAAMADSEPDSESDSESDEGQPSDSDLMGPAGHVENAYRMHLPKWVPRKDYSRLRFKVLAECASYESWQKALAYHQEMRRHGKELPASELIEFVEAALQMECMGFEGCHEVACELLDLFKRERNEHLPNSQKRFINPHIGSQLLRFAVQRAVRSLEVAHRLWDLLCEQRSKASRVSMRTYLIAMQRRDINNPRVAQVMECGKQWHGFLAKPEGHKLMKAGEQQGEEDSGSDNVD